MAKLRLFPWTVVALSFQSKGLKQWIFVFLQPHGTDKTMQVLVCPNLVCALQTFQSGMGTFIRGFEVIGLEWADCQKLNYCYLVRSEVICFYASHHLEALM